jgi:hypothetical protein
MAAALDATASSTSETWSHTVAGGNRLLVVAIAKNGFQAVTGVTYNGVAMTNIAEYGSGLGFTLSMWYLVAPATGTHNVVASPAFGDPRAAYSWSFSGVDPSSPLGTEVHASGSGSHDLALSTTPTVPTGGAAIAAAVWTRQNVLPQTLSTVDDTTSTDWTQDSKSSGVDTAAAFGHCLVAGSKPISWTGHNTAINIDGEISAVPINALSGGGGGGGSGSKAQMMV